MVVAIVFWVGFAVAVGFLAQRYGRNVGLWVVMAVLLSPVLAGIILLAIGPLAGDTTSLSQGGVLPEVAVVAAPRSTPLPAPPRRRPPASARFPQRAPDAVYGTGLDEDDGLNPDGGDRQAIIANLQRYDPLELVREPDGSLGTDTIRVDARAGTVGYIEAANAPYFADELDAGTVLAADVEGVDLGRTGQRHAALRIRLWRT